MSEREAAIRVTLRDEGFQQKMGRLKKAVHDLERSSGGGESFVSRMSKDADKTSSKFGEMGKHIRGVAVGLGLVHVGMKAFEFLKDGLVDAVKTEDQYKRIAFRIQAGTGKMAEWRDVMGDVISVNQKWGNDVDKLGEAYETLLKEVGTRDFAKTGLDMVGKMAAASGEDVNMLANAAVKLSENWKIGGKDMEGAMTAVLSLTNQGGILMEEFVQQSERMGPGLQKAGLTGSIEGLSQVIGFMNLGESRMKTKRQGAAATAQLLDLLSPGNNPILDIEKRKALTMTGVSGEVAMNKKLTAFDQIKEVMKATRGDSQLISQGFKGPMGDLMIGLGEIFQEGRKEAKGPAHGGAVSPKARMEAGLAALDAAFKSSAQVVLSKAQVDEKAKQNAESASAQWDKAMGQLKEAFSKPEIVTALSNMASLLPKGAQAFSALVDGIIWVASKIKAVFGDFDISRPSGPQGVEGGSNMAGEQQDYSGGGGAPAYGSKRAEEEGQGAGGAPAAYAGEPDPETDPDFDALEFYAPTGFDPVAAYGPLSPAEQKKLPKKKSDVPSFQPKGAGGVPLYGPFLEDVGRSSSEGGNKNLAAQVAAGMKGAGTLNVRVVNAPPLDSRDPKNQMGP